jgi:hypothetical protein
MKMTRVRYISNIFHTIIEPFFSIINEYFSSGWDGTSGYHSIVISGEATGAGVLAPMKTDMVVIRLVNGAGQHHFSNS